PEDETGEASGPRLAQRGGKVVALRGVMDHVRGPEKTAFVAHAMEPVVAEFVAEEEQDPGPPLKADRKNGEPMQITEDRELKGFWQKGDEDGGQGHADARGGVFEFIDVALHDGADNGFRNQQSDKRRDSESDEIWHGKGPLRALQHVFYTYT